MTYKSSLLSQLVWIIQCIGVGQNYFSCIVISRVYKRQELLTIREHLGSLAVFGGVRVADFLVFYVVSCFVCLRLVYYGVPYVASVSGFSIRDCPFDFL